MIALFDLIALGFIAFIAVNVWKTLTKGSAPRGGDKGPIIEGRARDVTSPAAAAAEIMRDYETIRAELKARYPLTFSMLGGYLNNHTIAEHGGVEGAVEEMVTDWAGRRDEAARELTRVLAENESEAEIRAIVTAACDADFDKEGYRAWIAWLLGRLSAKA